MTDEVDSAATAPPSGVAEPGEPERPRRRLLIQLAVSAVLVGTIVAGAAAVATRFGEQPGPDGAVLVGEPAPELAGETLGGETLDIAAFDGEVVLVNFWASWCPPCVEEFPVLLDAQERLGPHGLQVVGVNSHDQREDAEAFLDDMDAVDAFPHVVDPDGARAVEWGVFGLPETFVIDTDGTVAAKVVGLLEPAWIRAEVEPLLEQVDS